MLSFVPLCVSVLARVPKHILDSKRKDGNFKICNLFSGYLGGLNMGENQISNFYESGIKEGQKIRGCMKIHH